MAALDFGMALARGMLPKAKAAQKDLLNLAGGRGVFKSEDWWNEQVDKQISKGYREVSGQDQYYKMPDGTYKKGTTTTSFVRNITPYGMSQTYSPTGMMPSQPSKSIGGGYAGGWSPRTNWSAPKGAIFTKDKSGEKQYKIQMRDRFGEREDFTAGELSSIEEAARSGAEAAKRQTAEAKSSKRRLARATGGLMGKTRAAGEAPATGLPALGEGGLGIVGSILGGGIKL